MIPAWKLRRELDRLGQKARSLASYPIEGFVKRSYDRKFPDQLNITQGEVPALSKVAIFLIYQTDGILESTLHECRHLIDKGFAPLIVSNCPLSEKDRLVLTPVSWMVTDRPNYGYDFGGYRDGVRLLDHIGQSPDALLILNDSIWFPLHGASTVLDDLQSKAANVTGIVYHEDIQRRSTFSVRKAFLESYFFLFDKAAISSDAFKTYWQDYRVSSNKLNAVYRGERALCDAMRSGGLTVEGLVDRAKLLKALETQDAAFLQKTLKYAAYTDAEFNAAGVDILNRFSETEDWIAEAIAHVAAVTKKRNMHASFCYATMSLFGVCSLKKSNGTFLKKTYGTLHAETRNKYLSAVAAGDLTEPLSGITAEIQARQSATPTTP